jgi:hypothetical protein
MGKRKIIDVDLTSLISAEGGSEENLEVDSDHLDLGLSLNSDVGYIHICFM